MMKNLIFCLAFVFAALGVVAQNSAIEKAPAQQATEKMTQLYGLNEAQQVEMLKIQERKYRNLTEIEPLKTSDPTNYILKIRNIKLGNDASFERILTADQMTTMRQEQLKLREKKSTVYKELKTAGVSQQEIDNKMIALDLEAL